MIFTFGQMFWLNDLPLIDFVHPEKKNEIDVNDRVTKSIDDNKNWGVGKLANLLPHNIIVMITNTPIPISNTNDKLFWKFY